MNNTLPISTNNLRETAYTAYLWGVSLVGLLIVIAGIVRVKGNAELDIFLLLIVLAASTQLTATLHFQGINFSVSSAVSMAAIPLYGPLPAALIAAVAEISLWVLSVRADRPPWHKALQRLGFNVGMNTLAILAAGTVFLFLSRGGYPDNMPFNLVGLIVWLLVAATADQVNLWLLIIILYLQNSVPPKEILKEHGWAIPINVLAPGLGSIILIAAIQQLDMLGLLVFFLPIALSAYAFRVYTARFQARMDELEEMVALRTADLAHANEQLTTLHTEKDAFLAMLTHDMRNPLTAIKGYAALLEQHEADRDQQLRVAKIIQRAGDSLLDLVNNILDISKLEAEGKMMDMTKGKFDVALIVREIVDIMEGQASHKGISLKYEQVPNPIEIIGDEEKIKRVLTNLVSNAVKYTPGGGQVCVDISVIAGNMHFKVQDTGHGIPADELPYIFDRYRRVSSNKDKAVGTGLGLAIAKGFVEAHNGEIIAESEVGVGSTFQVILPLNSIPDL